MRARSLLAGIAVVLLSLCASGCWDRLEMDEVALVGSIGLDDGTGPKALVSLEILNPRSLTAGVGGPTGLSPVVSIITRDEADSVAAAVSNAQRRIPRLISLGQVDTLVFSQALARDEGIGPYLDSCLRETRVGRSVTVTICDTSAGLLQRALLETLPSRTLSGLSQNTKATGKSVKVTLNEFALKLSEPGVEPIAVHTVGRNTKDVEVKRQGEEAHPEEPAILLDEPLDVDAVQDAEMPSDSPYVDPLKTGGGAEEIKGSTIDIGIAAFRGDRFVGFLDGNEARGYLWLAGRLDQAALNIADPNGSDKTVGLEVIRASSSLKPKKGADGEYRIKAEIHVDLEVTQLPLDVDLKAPGVIEELEGSLNELITSEIEFTLRKVQQDLRTDVYGFGNLIYKSNYTLWKELEPNWNDVGFPQVKVDLEVNSRIRAPGAIYKLGAK